MKTRATAARGPHECSTQNTKINWPSINLSTVVPLTEEKEEEEEEEEEEETRGHNI